MRAIGFTRYGAPDGLAPRDVPRPDPRPEEVLVRVRASSVNSWDWEFLRGTPFVNRLMFGLLKPKPSKQILGADIAGTVEAVGTRVERFRPGDEVFGDLWSNWGGFAEFACAAETALEPKPANVTFEAAAAVPQAGVLALQGLRKGGELKPGQAVLINGAGGGVGTFAIQLAKRAGAEVTGVDAAHKLDVVRSLGADHAIDFAEEDYTQRGERYDRIVDCHGFRSMFDQKRTLKPGGIYAMIGGSMARVRQLWLLSLWDFLTREDRKLRLVAEGPNKGLAELAQLMEAGELVSVIDRTFTLDEVPEALHYFSEGLHKGKIAVSISS